MVPDGWKEMPLGSIARITSGATPKAGTLRYYEGGSIPFLKIQDLTDGDGLEVAHADAHITEDALQETSTKLYPPGTVLLTMYGTIGTVRVTSRSMAANQAIAAFLDLQDVDATFLAWILQHHKRHFEALALQTTQANISGRLLKSYRVPLPPLPEQRIISAILSSVDDAIAATRKVIEQTRRVKEGLLQTLMTRGIGHIQFKETEIGEIPKGWDVSPLSQLSTKISVGIASSVTHAYADQGVPLIRNQNIGSGRLLLDDLLYVTKELDREYRSKRLQKGDVVTMRTGEPGRSAVIPESLHGAQTFTTLIFRPKGRLLGSFLSEFMNSAAGRRQVRAFQAGGAQANLNVRVAKQIQLPVPPLDEQREIVHRINGVRRLQDSLRSEVEELQTLKRGLLQDLLTGRVRVQPD